MVGKATEVNDDVAKKAAAVQVILQSASPSKFEVVSDALQDLLNVSSSEEWCTNIQPDSVVIHCIKECYHAMSRGWDNFFHVRTGSHGCLLGGAMRIAFATIFLADRLLLTADFEFFFSRKSGIGTIPISSTSRERSSVFDSFDTEGDTLLWAFQILGIVQGLCLLLGIAPRFNAFCIFVNIVQFHNYNDIIYDSQDILERTWAWMVCFLPLHRLTIFEFWRRRGMSTERKRLLYKNDSWPLWGFRLFQIQLCFIFMGAGLSKANLLHWHDGTAMYYTVHQDQLFGGYFSPDFIFNRHLPLKMLTFISLFLEVACILLVWPKRTRTYMVAAMICFHLGIDAAMNLHIFQWMMILGWCSFLVSPADQEEGGSCPKKRRLKRKHTPWSIRHLGVNIFLILYVVIFSLETCPFDYIELPEPLLEIPEAARERVHPFLLASGLSQQVWDMYGQIDRRNIRISADITFYNGTNAQWNQPDWETMNWLEMKRYFRHAHLYDSLAESGWNAEPFYLAISQHISKIHGPGVQNISLRRQTMYISDMPSDLEWFDTVRQSPSRVEDDELFHWEKQRDNKYLNSESEDIRIKIAKSEPDDIIGSRIAKKFGSDGIYFGKVTKYDKDEESVWHILYDDEDEENLSTFDLARGIYMYQDMNIMSAYEPLEDSLDSNTEL